ncbi:MAG: hypothetical protein ACOVQ5_09790 [Flavobacteriales bacterium]|jgi:hypothetical protein
MKFKIVYLSLAIFTASCNFINPDEQDPAYIYIDQFSFSTDPGEGTENQKFTEIWAYANDQVIGVYDLPALIPAMHEGNTNLSFFAGIKNFGLSDSRIIYPFVQGFRLTKNLKPLGIDTIRPSFTYFDDLSINQKDWDLTTPSIIGLNSNQGELLIEDDETKVFEGNRCGYFRMPAGSTNLSFKDDENLDLEGGVITFLELNYSCNNKFAVGLSAREGSVDRRNLISIINPTTSGTSAPVWNKIYIDLGLVIRDNPNASFFEVYFESVPDTPGNAIDLYLDNMKIIHF